MVFRLFLFILLFPVSSYLFSINAAGEEIKYAVDPTTYNFGDLIDTQGPVSCTFKVHNTGETPFSILTVATSCGCTRVNWTKRVINPGETGHIDVVYANNEGPHPFDKSLIVKISDINESCVLHLRGNVIRKLDNPRKLFRFRVGPIALTQQTYNGGELNFGDTKDCVFSAYNSSRDTIRLHLRSTNNSGHQTDSIILPPQKYTDIKYTINAENKQYGKQIDTLYLTGSGRSYKRRLRGFVLFCYAVDSYASKSEAKPTAQINDTHYSLGVVQRNSVKCRRIIISNIGKGPLNIYHIETEPDLSMHTSLSVLLPGETKELEFCIDPKSILKRNNISTIDIYTDSTEKPVQHIYVTYKASWVSLIINRIAHLF